ncbi:hypothetical protein FY034_03075 [Trichlorobacter lovleyi]|uniref:hypothetical protein n=1 Tax=Trichlorobacter lovleyi TaxID=313985 RepID=UPI00223ECC9D|nr:hypothetical protein [Trichlorobacter lovleyi]QOX77964.1 hypothetical protein FY034_03075 [Trichlorobacter lovleyi]
MKKTALTLMAAVVLIAGIISSAQAWEVKIINRSGHFLRYEVYQQTWLGEKLACSTYSYGYSERGEYCLLDQVIFPYCPTRVNIYVIKNNGAAKFDVYQSMESGYLGAQCWNHSVEVKPVDPNAKKSDNSPMTWVWSMY